MIGANTLKATAVMNPSKRVMRAHERDAEDRIMRALDKLRRAVTSGMTADNVLFVPARLRHRDIIQPFIDSIVAVLRDISLDGAGFGREQIEKAVFGIKAEPAAGFAIDWELVNHAAEEWARRYGFGLVRGILDTTAARLQSEIANWTTNNETIGQLARRLAEPNGPFGLTRARTIAVTETTRAYAEGNRAAWRESKVIKRNRWNTNNDEAVCPICGPLHNAVADLDQPFPGTSLVNPPAHPNCRCWLSPVVADSEDLAVGFGEDWDANMPVGGIERAAPERSIDRRWGRVPDGVDKQLYIEFTEGVGSAQELLGDSGNIYIFSSDELANNTLAQAGEGGHGHSIIELNKNLFRNNDEFYQYVKQAEQSYQVTKIEKGEWLAARIAKMESAGQDSSKLRTSLRRSNATVRFSVTGSSESPTKTIGAHETAHAVTYTRGGQESWNKAILTALDSGVIDEFDILGVSEYAAVSHDELLAEVVALIVDNRQDSVPSKILSIFNSWVRTKI